MGMLGRRSRTLIVALILFGARSAWAAFGWSSTVTIDHTLVPSTQTDFPVLISITDARFKTVGNSGHVENANGYDIRPFSDSTCSSALTYELERYNATTGEVIMWVKIASLSSSVDTVIYLGYGDSGISTDGSSTSTWSNNFLGVYHLQDGTTLNVNSATGSNNGTNINGVTATTGQIDGAGGFVNASLQAISLGNINSAAVTLSAWVNATSFPNGYNGVVARSAAAYGSYSMLLVKSNGKLFCGVNASGAVAYDGTGSHTLSSSTWYYLSMTYDSSAGLVGYVNAASDGTAAANGTIVGTTTSNLIGEDINTFPRFWDGKIDEARIASVARSADWVTTEYNNQSVPGSFETLGTEVSGCPAATPTATATFTPTATATATATFTPTATATATATATPTATATATATVTPTATATATPTALPNAWFIFIPH